MSATSDTGATITSPGSLDEKLAPNASKLTVWRLCDLVGGALSDDELQAGAAGMKAAFGELPDVSEAVPLLERLAHEQVSIA